MKVVRAVAPLLLFVATTGAPAAPEDPVVRFALPNGLRVLLRPVEGATSAALVVLFDVGGDHDPEGRSGLSHAVEHLYVTCAAGDRPARTATELIREYAPPKGWNAQTGDRYTAIATVFPAGDLEPEVSDAAARMGDLRVNDADLERERPRILEEIGNMFGGIPALAAQNLARERVRPTPRGGRRGGTPGGIRAISRQEAEGWWLRHYKPRNASLVLAGGFDPEIARALVEKAFGPIAAGEPAPAPGKPGAPTTGDVLEHPRGAAGATACVAVRAPDPGSEDYAAFLRIAAGGFEASLHAGSRDPVRLVFAPLDDPTVFGVVVSADDATTARALAERAFEGLGAGGSPDAFAFLLGTGDLPERAWGANPYGLAFGLGRRAQLGIDPVDLRRRLDAVTEEELATVAARLFAPERRATVVVRPGD